MHSLFFASSHTLDTTACTRHNHHHHRCLFVCYPFCLHAVRKPIEKVTSSPLLYHSPVIFTYSSWGGGGDAVCGIKSWKNMTRVKLCLSCGRPHERTTTWGWLNQSTKSESFEWTSKRRRTKVQQCIEIRTCQNDTAVSYTKYIYNTNMIYNTHPLSSPTNRFQCSVTGKTRQSEPLSF